MSRNKVLTMVKAKVALIHTSGDEDLSKISER